MKSLWILIFIIISLLFPFLAWGTVTSTITQTLLPLTNNTYNVGVSGLQYANGYFQNLNVSGSCVGCGGSFTTTTIDGFSGINFTATGTASQISSVSSNGTTTFSLSMAGGTCSGGITTLSSTGTIICGSFLSAAITSLNGSTSSTQTFATSGPMLAIATANGTHTFTVTTSSAGLVQSVTAGSNLLGGGGLTPTLYWNATVSTATITTATTTNLYFTEATGTRLTSSNLFFTNATGTNLFGSSLVFATGTITSATSTNFTASNLYYTMATGTSLFSAGFVSATGTIGTLTLTNPLATSSGGLGSALNPAKGNILVGTGTGWAVLTVGQDRQVLMASSSATNGLAYQNGTSSLASAAGSDKQIQFNNGGALLGDANLTWASTTQNLTVGTTTFKIATGTSIFASGLISSTGTITNATTTVLNIVSNLVFGDHATSSIDGNQEFLTGNMASLTTSTIATSTAYGSIFNGQGALRYVQGTTTLATTTTWATGKTFSWDAQGFMNTSNTASILSVSVLLISPGATTTVLASSTNTLGNGVSQGAFHFTGMSTVTTFQSPTTTILTGWSLNVATGTNSFFGFATTTPVTLNINSIGTSTLFDVKWRFVSPTTSTAVTTTLATFDSRD